MTDTMHLLEILKSLILDFHESILDTGTPRLLQIETVQHKATVLIGVRRSGKSTYLAQRMQKLIDQGVPQSYILYLNFFDDRLHSLTAETLHLVIDAYFLVVPLVTKQPVFYCFFDEIQIVQGWERFIDRLMRTEPCEIVLTGSSARMLSKEIASEMRGRSLSWEVFPFSFAEFLKAKEIPYLLPLSNKTLRQIHHAYQDYWRTGGFPEVLSVTEPLMVRIHQEYFQAILFRDLVERHDIPHPKALVDVARWMIEHVGAMYTLNSLNRHIKTLGHSVSKMALSDYVAWLEDAYFLFTVRLFDASYSRSNANPKKIYCIDHAFVRSIASGILINSGHLLENLVFITLRRHYEELFYYKTHTSKEIDFVFRQKNGTFALIQVCYLMQDTKTRKREVEALESAMKELNLSQAIIITTQLEEWIDVSQGKIHVVPIWKFLLAEVT